VQDPAQVSLLRALRSGLLAWLAAAGFAFAGAPAASAAALSWQPPVPIGHGSPLTGISCPTTRLCVATDQAGEVIGSADPVGGSGAWSAAQITPSGIGVNLAGISCPSSTLCVAIDPATGQAYSSADPTGGASSWQAATIEPQQLGGGPAADLQSVSCASASLCVAVDDAGNVFTSTDPAGGAWQMASVNEGNQLDGVSCPSAALCVAVGVGFATSADPTGGASAWRSTSALSAQAVSCAGSQLCVAVDGNGNAYATTDPAGGPQAWEQQPNIDHSYRFSPLNGISCPTTRLCVAVNGSGDAVSSTDPAGGGWVSQGIDSGSGLTAVSCPDATVCLAVDGSGDVVVGTASIPSATVALRTATVPVRGSRAAVTIACARAGGCHGTITLALRVRRLVRRHGRRIAIHSTIAIASGRYSVPGASARAVGVRLSPAGLRALRRARGHRLRVLVRASVSGGPAAQRLETLRPR